MHDLQYVQLSRLREIGFREWDPIGMLAKGEPWKDHPAADEYDGYLLQVVSHLRRGAGVADAIDYLVWAESEHMGLGTTKTTRERAVATANAIMAYLEALLSAR